LFKDIPTRNKNLKNVTNRLIKSTQKQPNRFFTKFHGLEKLLKTNVTDADINSNLEDVEDQIDKFQKKTQNIRSSAALKENKIYKPDVLETAEDIEIKGKNWLKI
jgi:hypothetical protein